MDRQTRREQLHVTVDGLATADVAAVADFADGRVRVNEATDARFLAAIERVLVDDRKLLDLLAEGTTDEAGGRHQIAPGVFVAVPDDTFDPTRWRPGFEAAVGAIGVALFGGEGAVVTGLAAARLHRVVPRALAQAELAVGREHEPVRLTDREQGVVCFVVRDVAALDTTTVATEIGPILVTTPEQTLVDLDAAHDELTADVVEAMTGLARKVDWVRVASLVDGEGARRLRGLLR